MMDATEEHRAAGRAAALLFLAVLAAWNFYRAATQSITHDEALTYQLHASGSWRSLFTFYTANHHVLHTLAVKAVVGLFGLSKITLRLPALIGGIAYAFFAIRWCSYRFRDRWMRLAAVALLTLNPYVLDFEVAARGYSLALAFLMWHLDSLARNQPVRASIAAGLAVAANLTFAFPVVATTISAIALDRERTIAKAWRLIVPGGIAGLSIVGPPLMHATSRTFFEGKPTLAGTTADLAAATFHHGAIDYEPAGLVLLATAAFIALVSRRVAVFFAITLLVIVLELLAVRLIAHFPYPSARTGMYFIPIASALLLESVNGTRWGLAAVAAIVLLYVAQVNGRYFRDWRYDAATEAMFDKMTNGRSTPFHVCADWEYEPSLNFYRVLRHSPMEPVRRNDTGKCDFVLANDDQSFVGVRHDRLLRAGRMSQVAYDPESGTRLFAAVPVNTVHELPGNGHSPRSNR